MSWLLFLDESGHDGRTMPYEVNGGVALHASKLWAFIQSVRTLEQSLFGCYLSDFKTEIKGSRLLDKDRFRWGSQQPAMDPAELRKNALNFLSTSAAKKTPRNYEFAAYGQACQRFAEGILERLHAHDARLFAAIIPHVTKPVTPGITGPRKDIVFLMERFYYFLESQHAVSQDRLEQMGLLVVDRTEKGNDRAIAASLERYFVDTSTGHRRSRWIVPAPLFVESDMAYGVQAADVCIYILNWAWRFKQREAPIRADIARFADLLTPLRWSTTRTRNGQEFRSSSIFWVPDPYTPRTPKNKEGG
jgi:hypothetical protein